MKYNIFRVCLILLFPLLAYSQQNIEHVAIQLEPEKVVFLEKETKKLTITIQNTSSTQLPIEIAQNNMYNITVEAYDNLRLPIPFSTEFYHLKLNTATTSRSNINKGYSTVSVEEGQNYSFDIMLDDYIDFRSTGIFTIIVRFFPYPFNNKDIQIVSSPILISVLKDTALFENTFQNDFGKENTNEVRIIQNFLYPENTVITALQYAINTNWDGFFNTVDLYSFYLNIVQDTKYFNELDYHQQRIEIFNFIKNIVYQEDYIFLTNTDFIINKIQRTSTKAIVTSLVSKIDENQRKETRNYTFFLEKKAKSWKIINIDITSISIEQVAVASTQEERIKANLDYLIPADFIELESE